MKLENTFEFASTLTNSGDVDMKMTDDPRLFMMLSSTIYEYKVRAVIRELCCNAYDSHIEAKNVDQNFFVHLPTTLDPYFYVEDFGLGLSGEDVENIYTVYGKSTKTETNDLTGALGLGSKSPYSYTDIFEVRTRKDGVELVYLATKGSSFTFKKISETKTDEPNGVRIKFDVKKSDFYEFKNEFIHIMKSFKTCADNNLNISVDSYHSYTQEDYINRSIKSRTIDDRVSFKCVMGNVSYTTQYNDTHFTKFLEQKGYENDVKTFKRTLSHCLPDVLFFEMGELEFMLSRERLELTPKTIDAINNKLFTILLDIIEKSKQDLHTVKTPYDARNYHKQYPFSNDYPINIRGFDLTINHFVCSEWGSRTTYIAGPDRLFPEFYKIVDDLDSFYSKTEAYYILPYDRRIVSRSDSDFGDLKNILWSKLDVNNFEILYTDCSFSKSNVKKIVCNAYRVLRDALDIDTTNFAVFVMPSKKEAIQLQKFIEYYFFKKSNINPISKLKPLIPKRTVSSKAATDRVTNSQTRGCYWNKTGYFYHNDRTIIDIDEQTYFIQSDGLVSNCFVFKDESLSKIANEYGVNIIVKDSRNTAKLIKHKVQSVDRLVFTKPKLFREIYFNTVYNKIVSTKSLFMNTSVYKEIMKEIYSTDMDSDSAKFRYGMQHELSHDQLCRYNLTNFIDNIGKLEYNIGILNKYDSYENAIFTGTDSVTKRNLIDLIMNHIVTNEDKLRLF